MMTPCQRKPSDDKFASSSHFSAQSSPQVNLTSTSSPSPAAARRDATSLRFKLGVLCMLLLLFVMAVVYFITPRGAALRRATTKDGDEDPKDTGASDYFQATNAACSNNGQPRLSAPEQYAKYMQAIANARVVRVAAKSTQRANSAMELCGKLTPYTKRPFPVKDTNTLDSFDFDGEFHLNSSTQDAQVDAVLSDGKGFKWVTVADANAVGGESVVHSGCLLPSQVPPLSSLGNKETTKSVKWVQLKNQAAADTTTPAKASCDLALEVKFAGESYFVSEQMLPSDDDFPLACLEDDVDFQSESDDQEDGDGEIATLLRVESADVVLYLGLQQHEASGVSVLGFGSTAPSVSLCPELPTAIRINQVDTSQLSAVDAVDGDDNSDNPSSVFRGWEVDELSHVPEAKPQTSATAGGGDLPVADLSASDCPCRNGMKTCLFVHGTGVHEDVGVQDEFEDYWGKQVKGALPCCSVIKFTHFDTVDPAWYSRAMSRKLCRAAIAVSRNETYQISSNSSSTTNSTGRTTPPTTKDATDCKSYKVLKDMVVIAHSTGNLHLASAFLYGDCKLDPVSSRWLAIQGPMGGTMTANRVIKDYQQPNTTWDTLTKQMVEDFELCPISGSTKSLAFQGTNTAGKCLDTLYRKASEEFRSRAYATMCGVSPVGILSPSSIRFVALAAFSNHTSKLNDGAVELESCRGGLEATEFKASPTSRFYEAEINHDDGRMVHGDGGWGETRKPLKWLQCQF